MWIHSPVKFWNFFSWIHLIRPELWIKPRMAFSNSSQHTPSGFYHFNRHYMWIQWILQKQCINQGPFKDAWYHSYSIINSIINASTETSLNWTFLSVIFLSSNIDLYNKMITKTGAYSSALSVYSVVHWWLWSYGFTTNGRCTCRYM